MRTNCALSVTPGSTLFNPRRSHEYGSASSSDGSTEIFFPAFRNPSVALGVLGFLVLWISLTIVIFKDNAPLIFRIAWPSTDLLVGFWVLSLLFGRPARAPATAR